MLEGAGRTTLTTSMLARARDVTGSWLLGGALHNGQGPEHLRGMEVALEIIGSSGERGKDRKSTRLNSSHLVISYAVFCLQKKSHTDTEHACRVMIDHHSNRNPRHHSTWSGRQEGKQRDHQISQPQLHESVLKNRKDIRN